MRVRMSPELKLRAEVAAASQGMTLTSWVEQLLERSAPPVPVTLDGSEPVRRRPRRDTGARVPDREEKQPMSG